MIVVTGATGGLGRGIVSNLRRLQPAARIVASVRDPARAEGLLPEGVEVRAGDFSDPASLDAAFQGARRVLIVSADKVGDEARQLHRNAILAAACAGAGRVLYTSHMGARAGSPFAPADQHAGTEEDLAAAGLPFTSLRHGFYSESCLHIIGQGLKCGEVRVPEDGPVSWTSRADLAAADAAILADEAAWSGITPPLAAPQALTMAEVAAIASEVSGRDVRHVTLADAAWRDEKVAAGMPPIYADLLLGTFRAARRGDFAAADPTLERLLGRPARTMRDALAAFLG